MFGSKEDAVKAEALALANESMIANLYILLKVKNIISAEDIMETSGAAIEAFSRHKDPINKLVIEFIEKQRDVVLSF